MNHIWAFQSISPNGHYQYICANCSLRATLEVFGDRLHDLGHGIVCYREPIQLELL
jgi:hypothetical protein